MVKMRISVQPQKRVNEVTDDMEIICNQDQTENDDQQHADTG